MTDSQKNATKKVLVSYLKNFAFISVIVMLTGVLNRYLGWRLNSQLSTCLAALFYSGGTLSYLIDWQVKTFGGEGFAERLNEYLFLASYALGTIFTILSFDMSTN